MEIKMLPIAILGTFISIIISYFLYRYEVYVGRAENSPSLVADGEHSRTDMYTSVAVLIGLIGHMMGFRLDPIAAIIVGFLVIIVGIEIFQSGMRSLLTTTSFQFIALRLESVPYLNKIDYVGFYKKMVPHRRILITVTILFAIAAYLLTGLYVVQPGERAIVQRFGRIIKQAAMPGLHYRLPTPFESTTKLNTQRINRIEIGFRTREIFEEEPEAYLWQTRHIKGKYEKRYDEALMLTGDQNIVDVWLVVQYRVKQMVDYLFVVDAPEILIKGASEAVIRYLIAKEDIDILLTRKRHWIEEEIKTNLQGLLDTYGFGIEVADVVIPVIHPPIEVVPAFRSVASAHEDKDRYKREAESYYNRIVPQARADATRVIEEAKAYKVVKINRADGEAKRFLKKLEPYQGSRDITKTRVYLETMEKVLPGINKFILTPGTSKDILDLRPYTGKQGPLEGLTGGGKK
jgi:membrane protease subunit HflK